MGRRSVVRAAFQYLGAGCGQGGRVMTAPGMPDPLLFLLLAAVAVIVLK